MSYQYSKNTAPLPVDPQPTLGNRHWTSNSRNSNRNVGNGFSGTLGGFFEDNNLPMYKDKPYSYATSRRRIPSWKRKRVMGAISAGVIFLFMYLKFFSTAIVGRGQSTSHSLWSWIIRPPSSGVAWDLRRDSVKRAFELSWDGYEQSAWGTTILIQWVQMLQ